MRRKGRIIIYFSLSILLALFAFQDSGALSRKSMTRTAVAYISEDEDISAILRITGVHGDPDKVSNINKKYEPIGTITNNSNQVLEIVLDVTPDFSRVIDKTELLFGVSVDSKIEFTRNSPSTQSLFFTLKPGQSKDILMALENNQADLVIVHFGFQATNPATGTSIIVRDTDDNPRRIYIK